MESHLDICLSAIFYLIYQARETPRKREEPYICGLGARIECEPLNNIQPTVIESQI